MKKLYTQDLISEDLLFVDGLSRAGKFLLAKIISHLEGVEYFQSQGIIEHIPFLESLGLIRKEASISLFRLYLNNFVYDRFVGRNLNQRVESSSIINAIDPSEYLRRMTEPDGLQAVERALKSKRLPSFLVHECLPHFTFFKKAVPKFRMLNIQRHPIDLIYSWHKRGWGNRWGRDNLAFIPTLEIDGVPCPWFAQGWKEEWLSLSNYPLERVTKSIISLQSLENSAYELFEPGKQIFQMSYEALFSRPEHVITEIAGFIQREPHARMDEIFRKEGCPNLTLALERQAKINKIKEKVGHDYYNSAVKASLSYDRRWSLKELDY